MSILDNENPLLLNPELASLIGLNESIIVSQIYSRMERMKVNGENYIDGFYWVRGTFEDFQKNLPFWSVSTIKRTVSKLEKMGLLISRNYNRTTTDRTKWYTINFDILERIAGGN